MNLTVIFMIAAVLIIAIFDIWVIFAKGKRESISAWIIRESKNYPLLVLLLGIVLGHLTWSMDTFDWADRDYLIERCEEVYKIDKKH